MDKDYTQLKKAIKIAHEYHYDQIRHGGLPYVVHPFKVMNLLIDNGATDESLLCAAMLHDTVEDTKYTEKQLREDFGDKIANIVMECTRIDDTKYSDKISIEHKMSFLKQCVNKSFESLILKLADRYSNVMDYKLGTRLWYPSFYALQSYPMVHHYLNICEQYGSNLLNDNIYDNIICTLNDIVCKQYGYLGINLFDVTLIEKIDELLKTRHKGIYEHA